MVKCPVCTEEHKKIAHVTTHMIEKAKYHRGDDHQRYLELLTGGDESCWGRNDKAIASLMRRYYKKYRRLPTLQELENR